MLLTKKESPSEGWVMTGSSIGSFSFSTVIEKLRLTFLSGETRS